MKMRAKRKLPRKNELYLQHPGSKEYVWTKYIWGKDARYVLKKWEDFGDVYGKVLCWQSHFVERRGGIWVCGAYRFYDCGTPIPECETMAERLMFAMTLRKLEGGEDV